MLLYALTGYSELDGVLLSRGCEGVKALNPRQICNVTLAIMLEGQDADTRKELLDELDLPLDPMEQAEIVMRGMK